MICVGLLIAGPVSLAQEHNFPALNTFGRFFGIGWSHGYHSSTIDGRFEHHKASHPASMYASSGLLYPYDPNYSAAQVTYGAGHQQHYQNYGVMQPTPAPAMNPSNVVRQPSLSGGQSPSTPPASIQPPKPIEPPPAWLRQYLNDGDASGQRPSDKPAVETREEVTPKEASPSDKRKAVSEDDDDLLIPQTQLTPMQRYHQARQYQGRTR